MKRRYKIGLSILAVLAAGLGGLALYVSHDTSCGAAPSGGDSTAASGSAAGAARMQAITARCYGGADVLKLEQVAMPAVTDDSLLVKVEAASVNPLDWHYMRGKPYIMRFNSGIGAPSAAGTGVDFAGTVTSVGSKVTGFKAGDRVFGAADGAFGEYVSVRAGKSVARLPPNIPFEQAAALPVAAITALQALRDKGALKPGQKVLINGASGGVGTFAVQIAKALGAEVAGVCSTRNIRLVQSLGADRVIDYKQQDFTQDTARYDLILDTVGNHPLSALRKVLTPDGAVLMVGGASDEPFLGPLSGVIGGALYSKLVSQRFVFVLAKMNAEDLAVLVQMLQSGQVRSVIDRHYALAQVPDAVRYVEEGHARGKVIIDVAAPVATAAAPAEPAATQ